MSFVFVKCLYVCVCVCIHFCLHFTTYYYSVPRIDRRLGFFQTYFGLTGDQVRKLASVGSSGPILITYNLGRVKDVTFTIKEEMGFTSEEIVKLLLTRPRLWKEGLLL